MTAIRFEPDDMALFSAASHDVNPLHVSPDYARRTPFGDPVVFGILSALAIIGDRPTGGGRTLAKAVLDFRNPLFVGCSYQISAAETASGQWRAKIHEGARLMLSAGFTFKEGSSSAEYNAPSAVSKLEPARWEAAELAPGNTVEGVYAPPPLDLERLINRWGLTGKGISPSQICALLWTSYLVGMELPGERAAYARLEISFESVDSTLIDSPFGYSAAVLDMDDRFGLLSLNGELRSRDAVVARAQISAYVRPDSPALTTETLETFLPKGEALRGKTALVMGGSRGLGAALVQSLALQGATVYMNYLRSRDEAERVASSLPPGAGPIVLAQGDASDPDYCRNLHARLSADHTGLDILVCCASPAIRPMDFATDTVDRLLQFASHSLALTAAPLAELLPWLGDNGGWAVLISSEVTRTAHMDFPHYVAAKCAAEGLFRAAAERQTKIQFLIVRPPKLLTDTNNTPMGRAGAMAPEQAAAAIVKRLCGSAPAERVEVLEEF